MFHFTSHLMRKQMNNSFNETTKAIENERAMHLKKQEEQGIEIEKMKSEMIEIKTKLIKQSKIIL